MPPPPPTLPLPAAPAPAPAPTSLLHNRQEFGTAKIFSWRCAPSAMLRHFLKINDLKVPKLGLKSSPSRHLRLITMSTSATKVDHVVLFKVKPETPAEKIKAMVEALRDLRELKGVLELTVAPVLSLWPAQTSWEAGFTHALYSRHTDKASLEAYMTSSEHLTAVKSNVLPISADLLAVDWEASPSPPAGEAFGVIRIALLKLKDEVSEESTKELLDTLISYPTIFPYVGQVSAGPNFSPAMAKGFNYGYVSQFKSVKELEELTADSTHVALMDSKVNPHVEAFVSVDVLK